MEKYEIAVDARMIDASGIGTYLQNILPAICSTYKTVLLGDRNKLGVYQAAIIEFNAPIYSIKELIALPFLVPACKVYWSPHFNVPVSAGRAVHVVTTIHDVFHLAFYSTLNRKQKLYARFFYRLAAKRSDSIITVSNFSKHEIVKHTAARADRIKVIYNGVHQETFASHFTEAESEEISKKYKLPQRYILFVGNVKPHKNLIALVSALEPIFRKDESLFLVIVGKKDGFITADNQVGQRIAASPLLIERILFTGFAAQQDLPYVYQKAKLFVMPSLYEGFGLPPLEAMAASTLTAVSSLASLPEICQEGALYFNPYDEEDMRLVLEKTLNLTPEEEATLKNKATVVSRRYSWDKARQEHIKLFNEYIL